MGNGKIPLFECRAKYRVMLDLMTCLNFKVSLRVKFEMRIIYVPLSKDILINT